MKEMLPTLPKNKEIFDVFSMSCHWNGRKGFYKIILYLWVTNFEKQIRCLSFHSGFDLEHSCTQKLCYIQANSFKNIHFRQQYVHEYLKSQ